MTTRPAAEPLTAEEEASFRETCRDHPGQPDWFGTTNMARVLATLDQERAIRDLTDKLLTTIAAKSRAALRDKLLRVHYPPQIGTHYEQGFADCLRAVLAEFERP